MLVDLGVKKMMLLTNNPRKVVGLEAYGLEITDRCPLELKAMKENEKYLRGKKEKLNHELRQFN